jgi:hypothetical protein
MADSPRAPLSTCRLFVRDDLCGHFMAHPCEVPHVAHLLTAPLGLGAGSAGGPGGSGGGHGGQGAPGMSINPDGGPSFGNLWAPVEWGSGGGASTQGDGGAGGGLVYVSLEAMRCESPAGDE